jgi:ATP-dependent RNA helicase RhlE
LITFSELGLSAPILKALQGEGYATPTPIQEKAIPLVLSGRDLLGIAQTGTGKTAAFALPIVHRLMANQRNAMLRGCRVLVLSPTRELATQIAESFKTYGRHVDLTVAVVVGGVGHVPQVRTMSRGVDILVATPGRLLDHLAGRNINLAGTEILVLDEADQMLDLGFLPAIRRIATHLSKNRQNLFFSATMPADIGELAEVLLRDPAHVAISPPSTTVESVLQRVLYVESGNKRALLVNLLADAEMARTLVFTRTKRGADRVARHLADAGIRVAAIHGNKSQSQRSHSLAMFRASRIRVLVATDIAARGIDVDNVTHVVNFELPDVPESYVHRIGRTARAGAQGIAISLCDAEERRQLRDIERLTRQTIPAEDRRSTGGHEGAQPARRKVNGHDGKAFARAQQFSRALHSSRQHSSSDGRNLVLSVGAARSRRGNISPRA